MAQNVLFPVLDDTSATLYYELYFNVSGNTNRTQLIANYPLPSFVTVSPAGSTPCIQILQLLDSTTYDYSLRRYDHNGNFSNLETGTFTTGS